MLPNYAFPFRRRALVLALMLASSTAPAAIINVSGGCTLVAAINNANTDTDTDGAGFGCSAGSDDDHLSLTTNGLYTLTEVIQGDEDGLPWISSTITINGHGATIAHPFVAYDTFRLLHVATTGNLTLNNVTLTGGNMGYGSSGDSGILNEGTTTLNHSSVSGNSYGGVTNSGMMTLNYSSVSGNNHGGVGNSGAMTLNHSSVSGNNYGGVGNSGAMTLIHSIVSGNVGGVGNSGNMALIHSSVSGNSRTYGIFNIGTMTLSNSSVSHNDHSNAGYTNPGGVAGIFNLGKMTLNHSSVSGNRGYLEGGISNRGSMTLTDSSVSNNASGIRGTIYNRGDMTLTASRISGNRADYDIGAGGGHIENTGNLIISNSTISGNTRNYDGGGILNGTIGTVLLTNSVISGNKAGGGGAISNHGIMKLSNNLISGNKAYHRYNFNPGGGSIYNNGSILLVNTTLSGNSSQAQGGGIANKGNLVLSHSTLSGNTAIVEGGGGIKNYPGAELTLSNSIIANSKTGGDCNNEGTITLQGNNLIEDGSCGAPLSGDPKLAPLLDNGGPTPTHALRIDSPAIDAADKSHCVAIDQRNVLRPLQTNAECDLGAFERRNGIPVSVAPIMQFFDQQSLNGGISGTGVKGALNRLDAVRNQLFVAGHYKNRNKTSAACTQLVRTFKHIDPDNTPDVTDMVTGSAAGQLADQVMALRTEWLCK